MNPRLPRLPDGYGWHVEISNENELFDIEKFLVEPKAIVLSVQIWDHADKLMSKEISVYGFDTDDLIERDISELALEMVTRVETYEKIHERRRAIDEWIESLI